MMDFINDNRTSSKFNDEVVSIFPPDQLPQCWHDKARINALFAPFRQKSVNPEDWVSKLKFWSNLIKRWCDIKGCASFSLQEVKKVFIENRRSPACLETVIQEMLNAGEIKIASAYYEPPQSTWSGWAVNILVKKPMRWSFDTIKTTLLSPPIDETATYVLLENAKRNGEDLLNELSKSRSDIFDSGLISLQTVLDCSKQLHLSYEGTLLALHYLYCQNKVALKHTPDKNNSNLKIDTIIKLAGDNQRYPSITPVDVSIYTLQQNEKYLMDSISALEEKKELLRLEAKKYLESNKKNLAKNCLKKKRLLDASIDKRMQTLCNIQGLLARILESQSDGQVLDSYQSGLAALKDTMKELQLNSDVVQDTMADIQDTLEECDEIQSGLSTMKVNESDIGELENELQDLLQDQSLDEEESKTEPTDLPEKTSGSKNNKNVMENNLYPNISHINTIQDDEILHNILSKLPSVPDRLSPKQKVILERKADAH